MNFLTAEDMSAILVAKLRKRLGFGMGAKMHLTGMHVEGKVCQLSYPTTHPKIKRKEETLIVEDTWHNYLRELRHACRRYLQYKFMGWEGENLMYYLLEISFTKLDHFFIESSDSNMVYKSMCNLKAVLKI